MRVVCAACNQHYADIDSERPFAEKLAYSDAPALWHATNCTDTPEEHAAALQMVEFIEQSDAARARERQTL